MRVMAIDYGDARTGVAVSDLTATLCGDAFTIQEWDPARLAARIAREAREREVGRLVLGLPRNMDGSEGFQAQKVRQFMEKLQEAGLPVAFQDERLSTVSAHEALIAGGMRREERKGTVDKVAAAVILQQYLDKNR